MKTPADGWNADEQEAVNQLRDELARLQARHADDPPIDILRAAPHETLPDELQAAAARRLATDPWSRALIEGLDQAGPDLDRDAQACILARVKREARVEHHVERRLIGWWPTRTAWAGVAVAAMAALLFLVWPQLRTSSSPGAPQAGVQPSARVETPAGGEPRPAPVFALALDKPEVTLSLSALTWRGADNPAGADNALVNDLKAPLDAFRASDYARADAAFRALETRYPQAIEVFFYGGVSRLFLNEPERAAASLTRAGEIDDGTFAARVNWYRAVADERLGRIADARSRLDGLCSAKGERSAQACEAARALDATGSRDAR